MATLMQLIFQSLNTVWISSYFILKQSEKTKFCIGKSIPGQKSTSGKGAFELNLKFLYRNELQFFDLRGTNTYITHFTRGIIKLGSRLNVYFFKNKTFYDFPFVLLTQFFK